MGHMASSVTVAGGGVTEELCMDMLVSVQSLKDKVSDICFKTSITVLKGHDWAATFCWFYSYLLLPPWLTLIKRLRSLVVS